VIYYDVEINLHSYIGSPYWAEMAQLIDIEKQSGMRRARTEANARKALEEHLERTGMTLVDYEELKGLAHRPWHVNEGSWIYIPQARVQSLWVSICTTIRAAGRPVPPEQVRTALDVSSWVTNITPAEAATWKRFAVVTSGTGAKLSNQRGYREDQVIGARPPVEGVAHTVPVTATGSMAVDEEMVKPAVLKDALVWGGQRVGIGASRKMGWGRFEVKKFDQRKTR